MGCLDCFKGNFINFAGPALLFVDLSASEQMLLSDSRPEYVAIESWLREIEEIKVQFIEGSFSLLS